MPPRRKKTPKLTLADIERFVKVFKEDLGPRDSRYSDVLYQYNADYIRAPLKKGLRAAKT